jgi:hypothetical protein
MTPMEFSRAEYSALYSLDETAGICAIVAVVDMRRVAGTRIHCEGSVPPMVIM